MATGQPALPGILEFGVSDLQLDDQTVHEGDSFDITVTFEGSGAIWTFLELFNDTLPAANKMQVETKFYAEGMGVGAGEYDLGSVDTPPAGSGSPYSATITVDTGAVGTDLKEGVYRIQCLVQLENSIIMGYYPDDLLLSVYD